MPYQTTDQITGLPIGFTRSEEREMRVRFIASELKSDLQSEGFVRHEGYIIEECEVGPFKYCVVDSSGEILTYENYLSDAVAFIEYEIK